MAKKNTNAKITLTAMMSETQLVDQMKTDIIEDVRDGYVPKTVKDFRELNSIADAYLYGNAEDAVEELVGGFRLAGHTEAQAQEMGFQFINRVIEIINVWIKSGGITKSLCLDPSFILSEPPLGSTDAGIRIVLLSIDKLLQVEGDELALGPLRGVRFSLNQLIGNQLTSLGRQHIAKDINTIEHWRTQFLDYVGREEALYNFKSAVIDVWEPPISGHLIVDGFHRLAAAKLAGLRGIAARLKSNFLAK